MNDFFRAAKEKFDKGAREHKEDWPLPTIESTKHALDEFVDGYHYMEPMLKSKDPIKAELAITTRKIMVSLWSQWNDTLPQNKKFVEARNAGEKTAFDRVKKAIMG